MSFVIGQRTLSFFTLALLVPGYLFSLVRGGALKYGSDGDVRQRLGLSVTDCVKKKGGLSVRALVR